MEEGYRDKPVLEDFEARERLDKLERSVRWDGRFWAACLTLLAFAISWCIVRALDTAVQIEQIDPSLVVPAADRHRLTTQQDEALCTRACSTTGLLASECEWRVGGQRRCVCHCQEYVEGQTNDFLPRAGELPQNVIITESR